FEDSKDGRKLRKILRQAGTRVPLVPLNSEEALRNPIWVGPFDGTDEEVLSREQREQGIAPEPLISRSNMERVLSRKGRLPPPPQPPPGAMMGGPPGGGRRPGGPPPGRP